MKVNEGKLDRTIRIVVGLGFLSLIFVGPKTSWGYFGLLPLFTGIVGVCPLYSVLGISTCSMKKPESQENESPS